MVIFTRDPDSANLLVTNNATQRNVKLMTVTLANDEMSQLSVIDRLLTEAIDQVDILLALQGQLTQNFSLLRMHSVVDF